MSQHAARQSRPPWINSLIGAVLLLIAGLDVLMIGFVGWAAWERATLSERVLRARQEDPSQLQGTQMEIQELQTLIAGTRQVISTTLTTLPTEADVARAMADLRLEAASRGVHIVELSPQAAGPMTVPMRQYIIRADGDWATLSEFLKYTAQTSLPMTRIEQVTLEQKGDRAEIAFQLQTVVRPPEPWPLASPTDPNAQVPWQTP